MDALKIELSTEENKKIAEHPIENVQAYECYLIAVADIIKHTEEDIEGAIRNLRHAMDIIGDNALLYSGMALAYWDLVNIGARQEDYLEKARECVKKALALKTGMQTCGSRLSMWLTECPGRRASFL